MNCNIITDNKGNITDVKAPNGASSLLYKAALTFTNNNQNQALDIWAVSQTPSFVEEVLSPIKFQAANAATPAILQQREVAQLVTEYLKNKGQKINVLPEAQILEEARKRTTTSLRQGDKVYGFYDPATKEIYLTEEVLTSENLVHELYHAYKPLLKDQKDNKAAQQVLKQMEGLALQLIGGEQVIRNRFNTPVEIGEDSSLAFSVDGNRLFSTPLDAATRIAEDYMKSVGKDYKDFQGTKKLDVERATEIAKLFEKMKHEPNSKEVKEAYRAMIEETLEQYKFIISEGYRVEINNSEPYNSSSAMIQDLKDNKRMNILSTESEYGDTAITDAQRQENVLLEDSGFKDANGETLLNNDIFRFVHDFFGHAKLGNGFGPLGEENAWNVHARMYSPKARRAMTTETRGQNSYVNFSGINTEAFKLRDKARELRKEGKIEEANKLTQEVYSMMKFAEQKIGLLPEWVSEYDAAPTSLSITPEIASQLTEDGQGNFVFNHFSQTKRKVIKKGTGENIITARDESAALSAVGGLAMYYTMDAQTESGVGNIRHTVLIPKEKVYDTDTDPLGFEAEARQRFNEARPGQGFNSNYRTAFITQVAIENGFEMTVSRWRNNELRAQTTKELTPAEESIDFKERLLPTFEVGDRAMISGVEATVTAVDGQRISYKALDGTASGVALNNEMNRRSITKLDFSVNNTQLSSSVYNPRPGESLAQYRERLIEEAEALLLQQNSIQYFERLAKENGLNEKETKTFIQRVQKFFKDFSNWLVNQLGVTNVTAEQVAQMTQRELFDTITTSMLRGDFSDGAQGWVSNVEIGLRQLPSNPATPGQWVKQITEKGGKGTTQELEWIGLQDYLNEWAKENNAKSVPKGVVEQYINDNQIEIVEIEKGEKSTNIDAVENELAEIRNKIRNEQDISKRAKLVERRIELQDIFDNYVENRKRTEVKYRDLQLEGGENYREVLLTLPKKTVKNTEEGAKKELEEKGYTVIGTTVTNQQGLTVFGRGSSSFEYGQKIKDPEGTVIGVVGEEGVAELVNQLSKGQFEGELQREKDSYKSSHWEEANILAHVRMNERTLPNGERVMFIEEVQSDWAQEGKKKGFVETGNFDKTKVSTKKVSEKFIDIYYDNQWVGKLLTTYSTKEEIEADILRTAKTDFELKKKAITGKVPDMPYKKTDQWVGMAMRRVMQMATQEGFDRIAWVTGEQSADRYDLSKQVSSISYGRNKDGELWVEVFGNSKEKIWSEKNTSIDKIESVLGKEIAKKIENSEGDSVGAGIRTLTDDNLKVGGEGMKTFYNSILPKVAKKEAQRFDKGAKVDVVEVPIEEHYFNTLTNKLRSKAGFTPETSKQLSIEITPKMKEALSQGIPLFMAQPQVDGVIQPSTKVKGYNQISKGGATIHFKDGTIELIETAPESRGQGAARALLQDFTQMADQNKQTLRLMVAPRESETTESGLVALYKSVGFSFDRGSDFEMIRYPKRTAPSLLDTNGEPKLQQVLHYIEQSNAEGTPSMTQTEKQVVENMLRGLKLTSSNELLTELNKIFPNGQLSKDALDNSFIFTRGEVQRMTQENIDNLLTLKRQLNEQSEIVDNIDFNPEFIFTTNTKNKYGKTETTNPLVIEKEIAAQVAGIQDRAEFDRAFTNMEYTSVVEQYLENEAFAQEMYIRFSTMKQLPKVTMVEGQLADQVESNKATEIEHVLSFQNVDFRGDVQGLLMVTEDIWDNSPQEIEAILRSIEKKGIKAGIDLTGLTAAYENRTKMEMMMFLSALNNVNAVQSQESLEAFIEAYKDFFQVEDVPAIQIEEMPPHHSNKTLVYVENELSEYSMFNDYSLVKVDNNIYQRVNKVSNENLVEILYTNAITENNRVLPNSAYFQNGQVNNAALVDPNNKPQIIQNIQKFAEDNITALNIEESNIDTDVAQQLLLYKYYYNNPINTPVENNLQRDLFMLKDFNGDYIYLSTDFLHDFQVRKLQEQNKNSEMFQKVYNSFFINEKGLQLKSTDVISLRDLQKNLTLLSEQEQSNLKNYAAISKDTGIKELFTPQAFLFADNYKKLERDYYQNNPKALPLFKGDYANIDGETIVSKTATSDFLRIKNRLFEKADGNSVETYYRAIPIKDGNFYDLSEQNLPAKVENKAPVHKSETQISHNKLYSRAEESIINQENFDCQ